MQDSDIHQKLHSLITTLRSELETEPDTTVPDTIDECFFLFRQLINERLPKPVSNAFLEKQNSVLKYLLEIKGMVRLSDIPHNTRHERISLWQGDITRLQVDAITNAANSQMLGCFIPNHRCIDNEIHTFSGVQLRLLCDELMQQQGFLEPVGRAKITPGFNLPARFILHTVGPNLSNRAYEQKDAELLASCYHSCLSLAEENNLHSLAFCGISTGVFGFPKEEAARIAFDTVTAYFNKQPASSIQRVIFCVFTDEIRATYEKLLGLI
jgi:O-acetyl-ADP-ribose deacetylase (regulator of RNase III)